MTLSLLEVVDCKSTLQGIVAGFCVFAPFFWHPWYLYWIEEEEEEDDDGYNEDGQCLISL